MCPVPTGCAPRRRSLLSEYLLRAFVLSLAALPLLAPVAARAGTWSLHVTGTGSAYSMYNGAKGKTQTWNAPADATGSVTLASLGAGAACAGAGSSVSASATLSATVTGTWVPDPALPSDPAPASVIVIVQSTASANDRSSDSSGNPTPLVAGTADDGLGQGDPQDPSTGTVTGTKYAAYSGGSFTVSVSASGSAGATAGPDDFSSWGSGTGQCSVRLGPVSVSTSTPAVILSGTHDPPHGDNQVLTGQQVTASLTGTLGTVTSYTWSVGGKAFKNYDTSRTNNDQLVSLGSADLSGPAAGSTSVAPVSFYDGTAESLTVSCTATLNAPDGTSLSVRAQAPQINILKPTVTNWGIDTGFVQQFQYPDQSGQYHDMMGLLGPPNVAKQGQSWHDVAITVPTPFTGGTFAFAQLSTPDRKIYRHVTQIGLPDHFQYLDNGKQGLDNGFTFLNKSWAIPQASSGELTGDSPSQGVPDTVTANDGGGSDWYQVTASDLFTTWLMYQPPGGIWVPLQKYSWSWSGTMTKGTAGWSLQSSSPTSAATKSASATDTPPSWNLTHTNNEPFVAPN